MCVRTPSCTHRPRRRARFVLFTSVALALLPAGSEAAPYILGGMHVLSPSPTPAAPRFESTGTRIYATAVDPQGRTYVAGDFTWISGAERINLARFLPDGSLDGSFTPLFLTGTPFSLALQPDGKLLVAGRFDSLGGRIRNSIVRLNPDGTPDPDFRIGSGFGSTACSGADVTALAVQSDGRIIAGGCMTHYDGVPVRYIARLRADGTHDPSFDTGFGFNASVSAIAVQADGRIIVGGTFTQFAGADAPYIVRLNADGTRDPGFQTGVGFDRGVGGLAVQADGGILVTGSFESFNGFACPGLVRLTPTGERDAGFTAPAGLRAAQVVRPLPDGMMLLGGEFSDAGGYNPGRIVRIHADGTLDATYQPAVAFSGGVQALHALASGTVVACGLTTRPHDVAISGLAWIPADAAPVHVAASSLRAPGQILSVQAAAGGGWLASGVFDSADGQPRPGVARLRGDGTLDPSFAPPRVLDAATCVAEDADGRALAGGWIRESNGDMRFKVVRFLADGSVDPAFSTGNGFDGHVWAMLALPDATVIVCGQFLSANGTPRQRLARLRADGSVDPAFNPGIRADTVLRAMARQPDGRIIIGGRFLNPDDTPRSGTIRIHPDGTVDDSYLGPGAGVTIHAIAIQPDGKVLTGAESFTSEFVPYGPVRRFMPDGTLDPTFDDGNGFGAYNGFNGAVRALAVQPDGRIWVAGNFYYYRGYNTYGLARLHPDGSLDARLDWTGKPSSVESGRPAAFALAMQPDGDVLAGGTWMLSSTMAAGGSKCYPALTLANLSVRSTAGRDDGTLIVGLATAGPRTKSVLFRAVGPTLADFGIEGALADPRLTLHQNGVSAPLAENDDWGGGDLLKDAFDAVGAFPLPRASRDAALLRALPGGAYTAHISAPAGSGIALAEAYDAESADVTQQLVNISSRSRAGTGDDTLVLGFVIQGGCTRRLLVRGIGPTLAGFGVSGSLADPVIELYRRGQTVPLATNDDWLASVEMTAICQATGAFELPPGSADAAMVVVLPPGVYTAHLRGKSGATGIGLAEVYLID